MDWNRIRGQWQAAPGALVPVPEPGELQRRDDLVRRQVRRRDWLETGVAIVMAPVFGVVAWNAYARADWMALAFGALITAWCCYVPLHLWRVRRALPDLRPELALLDYLRLEQVAMLAQARMLERVWLWYLGPAAVGLVGLVLSIGGVRIRTVVFCGVMLVLYAVLGQVNRHVARVGFRAHAAEIERQIATLTEERHA